MSLQDLYFYFFAGATITAAALVVFSRNPVHSVLFLILSFFSSAGLFVMLGAEFIAMILIIVYVGAVTVLFLFVVMMLNINLSVQQEGLVRYLPVGLMVGGILAIELLVVVTGDLSSVHNLGQQAPYATPNFADIDNTRALGQLIYTDFLLIFQIAGMVLLLAMVGAIVLTLRQRDGVRRQVIATQLARHPKDAVEVRSVRSGRGA